MKDLRYPVGKYEAPDPINGDHLSGWIEEIAGLPGDLRRIVEPLSPEQLATRYRPKGWTVLQVVHHLADSHINSLCRFKLALTEDQPTIRPYQEALWAETADGREAPVGVSLNLLDAVHERWVILLRSLSGDDFAREFTHPEIGIVNVAWNTGQYAWHGRHHLAHIQGLIEREGW